MLAHQAKRNIGELDRDNEDAKKVGGRRETEGEMYGDWAEGSGR